MKQKWNAVYRQLLSGNVCDHPMVLFPTKQQAITYAQTNSPVDETTEWRLIVRSLEIEFKR